jgi:deazaflavin-dependent oxidoreductase (nitroreductase family)
VKGKKTKDVSTLLAGLSKEQYCYLTTTGRVSGQPHEIEIWFGILDGRLYLLSGGGETSDWVRNLRKTPQVGLRIAKHRFAGRARILGDEQEDLPIRKLLAAKYQGWQEGRRLSNWARTALPVAVDFDQGE